MVRLDTYEGPTPTTQVRLSNDGTVWGPWLGLPPDRAIPWTLAPGEAGPRTVVAQTRDELDRTSEPWTASLVYDPAPPVIAGLGLRPAPTGSSWVVTFAAADPSGIAVAELRDRRGRGVWSDWRTIRGLADGVVRGAPGQRVWVELRVTDRAGNVAYRIAWVP
jgi:hypothetical protein